MVILLIVIIIQLVFINAKLPKRNYSKEAVEAALRKDGLLREEATTSNKKDDIT